MVFCAEVPKPIEDGVVSEVSRVGPLMGFLSATLWVVIIFKHSRLIEAVDIVKLNPKYSKALWPRLPHKIAQDIVNSCSECIQSSVWSQH